VPTELTGPHELDCDTDPVNLKRVYFLNSTQKDTRSHQPLQWRYRNPEKSHGGELPKWQGTWV